MSMPAFKSEDTATTGARPQLITVEAAKQLDAGQVKELFAAHLNPGQLHFLKLLGFDRILVDRAEGMHYVTKDGRRILDFFGGFCSVAFGHNHPRIIAARQKFQDENRHEICMAFMSQYAAALAKNLATIAPGDLDMVFLGSTGSEAMEAALKVAEQAQGPGKSKILHAANSFHGKTKGVLSVTDSTLYQSQFKLVENRVKVPFGNIEAVRLALESDPAIGIVVMETIQGAAASSRRRTVSGVNCVPFATSTACSGSPTRCSAGWVAPASSSPSNATASCPTSPLSPRRSAAPRRRWGR